MPADDRQPDETMCERFLTVPHQAKHRMKVNTNLAIGVLKNDLIRMALEENPIKRGEIFEGIIKAIADNIVPVRKKRQFEHKNQHPAIKHPITKKRSF